MTLDFWAFGVPFPTVGIREMDHDPGLCNAGDRTKGLTSAGQALYGPGCIPSSPSLQHAPALARVRTVPTRGRFSEAGGTVNAWVSERRKWAQEGCGGSAEQKGRSQLVAGQKLWWVNCPDHVLTLAARPRALSEGFTRNGCGVLIRSEIATTER